MPDPVSLEEITADTLKPILELHVKEQQQKQVAPNAVSIAEAHFSPDAWFRGIYAGAQPVGFVMLSLQPKTSEYSIWRFMIDARYQGQGYGSQAMKLVLDFIKTLPGASQVQLSFVPGLNSPQEFYEKFGFSLTGLQADGEDIMSLDLGAED